MTETRLSEERLKWWTSDTRYGEPTSAAKMARELLDLRAKVAELEADAQNDYKALWEADQAENRQLREALRDFALELGPDNPRSCSRQYVAQRIQKLAALGEKP